MFSLNVILALLLAGGAAAHEESVICGSYAFPLLPDSCYEEARLPRARPAATHQVGDQEVLWIRNYVTNKNEQIAFTYRAVNAHSYILVANQWWSNATHPTLIDPDDVARLSEVFERNSGPVPGLGKGIYELLTTTFASVAPVGGDSMVYIAVAEIKSNYSEGYIVGYVSPNDQVMPKYYPESNYRNLLVLNAANTSDFQRERTLSHEFLHIIHLGIDRSESRWVDEGIAVYSQTLCGYPGNTGSYFFGNTNIGLYDGTQAPTLADYDKSYLLMQYMADRYGVGLLGEVVRSVKHGVPGIDAALAARGVQDRFDSDVFPAWALANLSAPDPDSRYAYRTYNPRLYYPADFGKASPLPIQEQDYLTSYGVRYIRAGSDQVQGEITVASGAAWTISSVENVTGAPISIRPWFGLGAGVYRDCALGSPWLVLAPTAAASAKYAYSLDWHAPTTGLNPTILERGPMGTGVAPYAERIHALLGNLDPGQEITVTVTSKRLGPLERDIRLVREGLQGRCGENVCIVDSTSAPLPGNDLITVLVSDVLSPFGGLLSGSGISWQFGTGSADTDAPRVTIGLLANPVLPAYLTAVVLSNEALYPDTVGQVCLVVNGASAVFLQAQDAAKQQWIGTFALTETGQYEFLLRAVDLAGNAPHDPTATYAVVIGDDQTTQRARLADGPNGSTAEVVVLPGTVAEGLPIAARIGRGGEVWLGPEGRAWAKPVRVGLSLGRIGEANALRREADGFLIPLTPDAATGLAWALAEKPGTYALASAPVRPIPFSLGPNVPNPFNPTTRIPVSVPPSCEGATLSIYSISGQLVRRFEVLPGVSTVTWDASDAYGRPVASGVYLAELLAQSSAARERRVLRMVVSR